MHYCCVVDEPLVNWAVFERSVARLRAADNLLAVELSSLMAVPWRDVRNIGRVEIWRWFFSRIWPRNGKERWGVWNFLGMGLLGWRGRSREKSNVFKIMQNSLKFDKNHKNWWRFWNLFKMEWNWLKMNSPLSQNLPLCQNPSFRRNPSLNSKQILPQNENKNPKIFEFRD